MQQTDVDGCIDSLEPGGIFLLQAVIGMKPEVTTLQVTAFQEIAILPMGW